MNILRNGLAITLLIVMIKVSISQILSFQGTGYFLSFNSANWSVNCYSSSLQLINSTALSGVTSFENFYAFRLMTRDYFWILSVGTCYVIVVETNDTVPWIRSANVVVGKPAGDYSRYWFLPYTLYNPPNAGFAGNIIGDLVYTDSTDFNNGSAIGWQTTQQKAYIFNMPSCPDQTTQPQISVFDIWKGQFKCATNLLMCSGCGFNTLPLSPTCWLSDVEGFCLLNSTFNASSASVVSQSCLLPTTTTILSISTVNVPLTIIQTSTVGTVTTTKNLVSTITSTVALTTSTETVSTTLTTTMGIITTSVYIATISTYTATLTKTITTGPSSTATVTTTRSITTTQIECDDSNNTASTSPTAWILAIIFMVLAGLLILFWIISRCRSLSFHNNLEETSKPPSDENLRNAKAVSHYTDEPDDI